MPEEPGIFETVFNEMFGDQRDKPNKFTVEMGSLIRQARESNELSQAKLATDIGMRRATLSNIENGKNEPNATELTLLAAHLGKPISYFFPKRIRSQLSKEDQSPEELELLGYFREIWDPGLMKVGIGLIEDLSKYDPTDTLRENLDLAIELEERDRELEKFFAENKKRRSGRS